MFAKARLAKFEKNDANISVKKNVCFPGSSLHGHDFYELDIIAFIGKPPSIHLDLHITPPFYRIALQQVPGGKPIARQCREHGT